MKPTGGACCVLAADEGFFDQAKACVGTLVRARAAAGVAADIVLFDLGLGPAALDWLAHRGVVVRPPDPVVPRFRAGPAHAWAMSCRPFLPRIVPGYEILMWVDADIRFLAPGGLAAFLRNAADPGAAIAIVPEADPAYPVIADPVSAATWQNERTTRLTAVYGADTARRLAVMPPCNAGLFAAAAASPVWDAYRRHLEPALDAPWDRMREQDALNVAIHDLPGVARAPTTLNWLCSLRLPWRAPDGSWRHPHHRGEPIRVAHLTQSDKVVTLNGRRAPYIDHYRAMGLSD
ncbi:MAG: hypothetical protein AB7P02_01980 [Alphaproteobacteria bacterium]